MMMHLMVGTTAKKKTESLPVVIDSRRMDQALNAKRFIMPQGLSREEMRQHILDAARKK